MLAKCSACNLSINSYQQIQTAGNCSPEECELLIVADYPKQDDDITGYPLSGDQYKFLWELLYQVGIKYQVTYLVRCLPVDARTRRYRKPEPYEYQTCIQMKLAQELEVLKPECMIAFGKDTLMALTGSDDIGSYREYAHEIQIGNVKTKLLATYHPNFVINNDNDMFYNRFIEDVVYACRHAASYRESPKYKSMTVTAQQFSRIVDIWCNDPSIKYVGYDNETNGLSPWIQGSKITSFSVSVDGKTGYNIFLYHPELDISDSDREIIKVAARKLLTTKKVVVHHAKHEHRYAKTIWGFTPNITEDTMYMSFILFMGYPGMKHGLKLLSGRFILMPPWEEKIHRYVELYKAMKRVKSINDDRIMKWREDFPDLDFTDEEAYRWFSILKDESYYIRQAESGDSDLFMWLVPTRVMEKYAGMDAIAPLHLMNKLKPMIEADSGLLDCYNMIVKAAEVFANIELRGVRLQDRQRWIKIYHEHLDAALEKIREYPEVKELERDMTLADKKGTPQIYNPGSAVQTKKLFFEKFRFPVKETTGKGEPSTGETVIIALIKEYREKSDPEGIRRAEFLLKYREYKKLQKLLSAYFEGLSRFAHMNDSFDGFNCKYLPAPNGEDEVIHPGYTIHGTSCLVAGTKLMTDKGLMNIEELTEDHLIDIGFYAVKDDILVYDGDEYRKPFAFYYGGFREVYKILTEDGGEIIGTAEHPLHNGEGWIEIKDISPGIELMRYDEVKGFYLSKVVSKEYVGKEEVYDITMEKIVDDDFYDRV